MRKLFVLLAAATLMPATAQANAIVNGTFGSLCGSGSFCTYNAGDSVDIPGWTVINGGNPTDANGSVDLIVGYWQAPPGGGNSVDLDGNAFGGVSQTFGTVIGQQYDVTFFLSGNPDGAPSTKMLEVSDGTTFQNYLFSGPNSKASMGWLSETFSFLATSAFTTLSFTSRDSFSNSPGFFGPVVGNVDVEPVPEPGLLSLLGLALLSLWAAWTQQRSANSGRKQ